MTAPRPPTAVEILFECRGMLMQQWADYIAATA